MTTPTQTEIRSESRERAASAERVMGFAVLGCLAAGTVGVLRAMSAPSGLDVLLCLLGSVAAFGLVFYIYLGRD